MTATVLQATIETEGAGIDGVSKAPLDEHGTPVRTTCPEGAAPDAAALLLGELDGMAERWFARRREMLDAAAALMSAAPTRSDPLAPVDACAAWCRASLARLSQDIDDQIGMAAAVARRLAETSLSGWQARPSRLPVARPQGRKESSGSSELPAETPDGRQRCGSGMPRSARPLTPVSADMSPA